MKNKTMLIRAVMALLVATLVATAAACGGGAGSSDSGSGKEAIVSSKDFTEQVILGELYAQSLEDEGYTVQRKLSLGSEQVNDKSLVDGSIDLYPEYTGTAYVAILKKDPETAPKSEAETYKQVAKYYENRKDEPMKMLKPAPFDNNYGIVVKTELAEKLDLKTLADLSKVSDKLVFSSYSQFQNRSDGYDNLKKNYPAFDFKDIKNINSLGIRYKALAEDKADVAIGFTTDGQLASEALTVMEDPKSIWPKYHPAPVTTQKFLKENPDAEKILNEVSASIGFEEMREMNAAVDLDQEDPEDVAQEHLDKSGLLGD
jgi:osmoprotectant transport system substrate-binding protein